MPEMLIVDVLNGMAYGIIMFCAVLVWIALVIAITARY
jgi:hypothetical protein